MAGEGRCTVGLLLSLSLLAVPLRGIHAAYSIKNCMKGNITFYEDTNPTLECEGIGGGQNIYWSIIDTEDNEIRIGDCNNTRHCYGVTNSDYNLTRPTANKSILQIQHSIRQKDGQKIKCSRRNNNSMAFCTLDIIYSSESLQELPTMAIAGGVGAAVVIIVVVIVVLVIISRRKKRAAEENQVINEREEANEPEWQTYDKLQPASLADNRDYTELTVSTVSSGLQSQDARQTYERLQPDLMADNRDYTALSVSDASRGQRSQDNMYYNAALESDQSAGPIYTNFEGATPTNGT